MILPFSLSAVTEFQYYNYVFDGIIVLFTIGYLIAGFKRGILRSFWCFIFNLITLAVVFCIVKFLCPLFIDKIPVVLVNLIPNIGISFALTTLYRFILKSLVVVLSILIIRFGIFKFILKSMKENDYKYSKKKNFFGRVVAALLTGGLAFTLSSGAIVATRKMTGYTLLRNYDSEISETYVAKYGDKMIVNLVRSMVASDSMDNPHNMLVGAVTNGEHCFDEMLYYRDALYRLLAVKDPDTYFSIVGKGTNEGLIRFSEDLHVWAVMAEIENNKSLLNNMVSPLLEKAIKEEYRYTGDVEELAPVYKFESLFSSENYANITAIYY